MLDFIVTQDESLSPRIEPVCKQRINEVYEIWSYEKESIPPLSIANYSYLSIPKCLGVQATLDLEVSGILKLQNQPTLSLKGQGVLIAIIDSGIQYQDSAFLNSTGESRIFALWDQTDSNETERDSLDSKQENFCQFGTEYTKQQINEALRAENPFSVVPERDEQGHGTFLASVAGGSPNEAEDFSGAAPEAEFLVVKLREANPELKEFFFIPSQANAYAESDIMLAVEWAHRKALEQNRPLVVCIGLGCNNGSHNGTSPLCEYLNSIAAIRHRAVVCAAGNEAANAHHYIGKTESVLMPQRVEINVERDSSGFYVEFWGLAPEQFMISIQSPTGEIWPKTGPFEGRSGQTKFLFEETELTIDFRDSGRLRRDQLIFMRFSNVPRGIWTVLVYPRNQINGYFHMWLPISGFLQTDISFISPNPDTTLTMPSDAETPMTVGGYQAANNANYLESGRGFTSTDRVKPDIIAPAVNVSGKGLRNNYITGTGTSAAAALTAGACAQLLEWAVVKENALGINSIDIKNLLIRGSTRIMGVNYPSKQEGWGRLEVYQAFENIRL